MKETCCLHTVVGFSVYLQYRYRKYKWYIIIFQRLTSLCEYLVCVHTYHLGGYCIIYILSVILQKQIINIMLNNKNDYICNTQCKECNIEMIVFLNYCILIQFLLCIRIQFWIHAWKKTASLRARLETARPSESTHTTSQWLECLLRSNTFHILMAYNIFAVAKRHLTL